MTWTDKYGSVQIDPKHRVEHNLGGKVYDHAHSVPFGVSLRLPYLHRYPTIFRSDRKRVNLYGILLNTLIPWVVFCAVLGLFSFSCYFYNPLACWATAVGILVLTAGGSCCCMWLTNIKKEMYAEEEELDNSPMWFGFLSCNIVVTVVLGVVIGQANFASHMIKVYQYSELATYTDVNPADYRGAQLPDAGVITFTKETHLRTNYSMGFKNSDTYCVAPIVSPNIQHYDNFNFWAVGMNCCTGTDNDYTCDGYNDEEIHGGLRLLDEDARPFYRLAVQQAEATNFINTDRPLFFIWTKDPQGLIKELQTKGLAVYLWGVGSSFCVQCFIVLSAILFFAKLFPMDASP